MTLQHRHVFEIPACADLHGLDQVMAPFLLHRLGQAETVAGGIELGTAEDRDLAAQGAQHLFLLFDRAVLQLDD